MFVCMYAYLFSWMFGTYMDLYINCIHVYVEKYPNINVFKVHICIDTYTYLNVEANRVCLTTD